MSITKTSHWTGQDVTPVPHPTKPGRMVAISPNGRAFWESNAKPVAKKRSRSTTLSTSEEVTDYGNTIDD